MEQIFKWNRFQIEQILNGTELNGTDFERNIFQMEQISILNIFWI
jgi:hypothetical protein